MKFSHIQSESSLRKQVVYIIIFIIIIEIGLFIYFVKFDKNFNNLNLQSFKTLDDLMISNTVSLEKSLLEIVEESNIIRYEFNNSLQDIIKNNNINIDKMYSDDKIFTEIQQLGIKYLVKNLNNVDIENAFIIFNGNNIDFNNKNLFSSIYLNYNDDLNEEDIFKNKNKWRKNLKYNNLWNQFYSNINYLDVIKIKNDYEPLGRWLYSHSYIDNKSDIITYIMPLIDSNNRFYGIYGIEISFKYISDNLTNLNHSIYNNSFFALGFNLDNDKINVNNILYDKNIAHKYFNNIDYINLYSTKKYKNIKKVYFNNNNSEIFYLSYVPVDLGESKGIFKNQKLYLLSFVSENDILLPSRTSIHVMIIFTLFFSIINIGIFITFVYFTSNKIIKVSKNILNVNKNKGTSPKFEKTSISELNELLSSIEKVSNLNLESAKRIKYILETIHVPVGCFEDPQDGSMVFVTNTLIKILDIQNSEENKNYIDKSYWDEIFTKIKSNKIKGKKNVYGWKKDTNSILTKCLRIENDIFDGKNVGIIIDVTDDIVKQQQLESELDYDVMTRLLNRNAFRRKIHEMVLENPNKLGALIFADLDNLKYINDNYGHALGDNYIIAASEMFAIFRSIGGIVSRISGDEFAIFVYNFDNVQNMKSNIYKIINNSMNNTYITLLDNEKFKIKASLGISLYGIDSKDINMLIKYADFAMYQCKYNSKGGIVEFDKEVYLKDKYLIAKNRALDKLISKRLIEYLFQPIVDIETCQIYGYKSFIKSNIDEFKTVLEIFAAAESQSRLYDVQMLIINKTIDLLMNNRETLGEKRIFISIIMVQNISEEDFQEISNKIKYISKNIVIELTRNLCLFQQDLLERISMLRDATDGIIALGNDGRGYIDESELFTIKPDIFEIDKGILGEIYNDIDKQNMFKNLVAFCNDNNIKVLAEQIDTEQELDIAISLGVNMVQGNYFEPKLTELKKDIKENKKNKILNIKNKLKKISN